MMPEPDMLGHLPPAKTAMLRKKRQENFDIEPNPQRQLLHMAPLFQAIPSVNPAC